MTGPLSIDRRSAGVITLDWLREFARVSGDMNPIHQDVSVAKAMGLPNVIAHGMLIAGLIHSRAEEVLAETSVLNGTTISGSKTRFKAMTLVGDEVFTQGAWESAEFGYRMDFEATNQRGETLVVCQIMLRMAEVRP